MLIGGNARTFLCTFQLLLERLVLPLDPERRPHPGADVFAFLKTVDPGPKNQTGNDRTYPDVSKAALRAALATYPHVVGSTIVMEPACQGACLLAHHVRCRERFTGFLGDPGHLARATAFATGLEFLGKELEALEDAARPAGGPKCGPARFCTPARSTAPAPPPPPTRAAATTQHKAMLRRDPTRIEMKPEDIEEFDAYVAQQKATKKEDKGEKPTKKDERDARIGYRPTMSDSPGY